VIRGRSFVVLLLAAALPARAGSPPVRSPQLVALGKRTYGIYCTACHGEKGEGDGSSAAKINPKPRNFRTDKFRQGSKVAQIFKTLGKGLPGTAMVNYTNLSEEERWALSYYVLELKAARQ
jgi:mono/diheme cytochrome c family protein